MRPALTLAVALAAVSLAAGAAVAAEPECPPAGDAPRVEVRLEDSEPSLDHSAGMGALRAETAAPSGAAEHHHLGTTTSRVEWQNEIEARIETASGRVCARPERVSVAIRHAEHRIRIARELSRGSCLYRETMEHERRHVAVNRAALREAAARAEAAARDWAASAVGRGATQQSAMEALRDGLRRAIAPAMEGMEAARDKAHREIDTPEEYRRLGRVCPDDQEAVRERSRGGR